MGDCSTFSPEAAVAKINPTAIFESTFPLQILKQFPNLVILHTYLPMKMEQRECSETSAYKIQTPGNYPEESLQQTPSTLVMNERFLERRSLRICSRYNSGEFNKEFWEERYLHNSW
jgi:hypothetical protein